MQIGLTNQIDRSVLVVYNIEDSVLVHHIRLYAAGKSASV